MTTTTNDDAGNTVRRARVAGFEIAYELHGAGEDAIVLVHGWAGDRGHWHQLTSGLGIGRRLLAVDLLGHGDSDKPAVDYSTEFLARGVAAAMDHGEISRAVLVGHSNGGLVAREFHRLFPDRTEALVLLDSPLRRTLSPAVAAWMEQTLAAPNFEQVARQLAGQTPRGELSDEDYERVTASFLRTPQHVHVGGLRAMTAAETWHDHPIEVPLLVVMTPSPQLGDDYEQFVRTLAPQVDYRVWPCGHAIAMERPAELCALLTDFVEQLAQRGRHSSAG